MWGADPAPYTLAGAFVLGAALAAVVSVRIMRAVLRTDARYRNRERDP